MSEQFSVEVRCVHDWKKHPSNPGEYMCARCRAVCTRDRDGVIETFTSTASRPSVRPAVTP